MSGFTSSRRTMLAGSAMLLASTAMPDIGRAQTPKKGGRLVLAADSEPRNLNPAIVASNGVFFISSKIVETLAEASFEVRQNIGSKWGVVAFVDTGTVGQSVYPTFKDVSTGAGLGIRYNPGFAPIRADVSLPS